MAKGVSKTMPCVVCGAWTEIVESRVVTENTRRRRYECGNGHRFVTLVEETLVSVLDDRGVYVKVVKESK